MTELIIIGIIVLVAILGGIANKSKGAAGKASIGLVNLLGYLGGAVFWIVIAAGVIGLIYFYIVK